MKTLVSGKDIKLVSTTYGTECNPRTKLEPWINVKNLNEAVLFNPRNGYLNYNVAVTLSPLLWICNL